MPLGNSITEGTDGDPPAEGMRIAYRYKLFTLLTASSYNFNFVGHKSSGYDVFPDADNGGIPGTRDQYLVRLLQDGYDERWGVQITPGNQPYLDVYPADIILLHIGTNDITHDEGASPNSVSQILDEIDAWEIRSGNDPIVMVAKIINRKSYSLVTSQYNNNVAAMVAARNDPNIIMVDIENGASINYSVDIQSDGIHPEQSGYDKMGQKWFEAIQALNKAPYFTSTPLTSATEDVSYSYTVTVEDDNPLDDLTLIAGTLPSWCTFTDYGNKTGLLTGIPVDSDLGDNPVSLVVSDGKVLSTQNFTIHVDNINDPPLITGQHSIETDEDTPYTLLKADFTIVDDDNPISELDLIVLDGDNYSVEGTTITPDQNYYGILQVNVRVSDQEATSDIYQASVTVNSVNDPPLITGQKSTLEAKQLISMEVKVSDLYYEDVDNNINQLSVVIQPDPESIFIVNGSNLTVVEDTIGVIDVLVVLDDGEDISNEFYLQVKVLAAFNPPEFITTPQKEASTGKPYFYLVEAIDPDEGDVLSYSAPVLPGWLNFNEEMKLLGGSPSVEDTGLVWVVLEVSDGLFVVEQRFQLEVRLYTSSENETHIETRSAGDGLIKNIYPVPASDMLYLTLENEGEIDIQVVSSSGKSLLHMHRDIHPRSDIEIDLNGLNPGIYFIRVISGERIDSRKFIIRK
ncbi:MAG: putative Ig domain-containing protein [Bacteroidota bacterium]